MAPVRGPLAPRRAIQLGCRVPGACQERSGRSRPGLEGGTTVEQVGDTPRVVSSGAPGSLCKCLEKPSRLWAADRNILSPQSPGLRPGRGGPRAPRSPFLGSSRWRTEAPVFFPLRESRSPEGGRSGPCWSGARSLCLLWTNSCSSPLPICCLSWFCLCVCLAHIFMNHFNVT